MKLKRQLLLSVALCLAMLGANAQTAVVQGVKLPKLTTAQRDDIPVTGNPYAGGQVIYNTDTDCMEFWNGTDWVSLCDKGGGGITPRVPDYPSDLSGDYHLSGKRCFDVKQGNDNVGDCMPLASRIDDFESEFSFAYTFSGTETYSDLTFYIDNNNDNLLASVSTAGDVFTITFKSDIHSLAAGTDKTTAKKLTVVAAYKNNIDEDKLIMLEVSVQDCSCGCPVKTPTGTWLTFQCYNLGADPTMTIAQQKAYVPSGETDATVYGDLYQWGRATDGHEKRTSDATNTWATTDTAPHDKFVLCNNSPYDWRHPQNDNLWQPDTKVNNPCDDGWRVPTMDEWCSIFSGTCSNIYSKNATANNWTWNGSGTVGYLITPTGSGASGQATLFLPAAGSRHHRDASFNGDGIETVGITGHYWSSTPGGGKSYSVWFNFDSVYSGNSYYNNHGTGNSVRCVAEY